MLTIYFDKIYRGVKSKITPHYLYSFEYIANHTQQIQKYTIYSKMILTTPNLQFVTKNNILLTPI